AEGGYGGMFRIGVPGGGLSAMVNLTRARKDRTLGCDSRAMMGRLNHDQGRLFYSFCLEEAVPDDHLVRRVAAVLDPSWMHAELSSHYPGNGRACIDPELMDPLLRLCC